MAPALSVATAPPYEATWRLEASEKTTPEGPGATVTPEGTEKSSTYVPGVADVDRRTDSSMPVAVAASVRSRPPDNPAG
jgi:hypothetical protein